MRYLVFLLLVSTGTIYGQGLSYSQFPPVINSDAGKLDTSGIFLVTQTKPGGGLKTYRTNLHDVRLLFDTINTNLGWRTSGNDIDTGSFLGTTNSRDLIFKTKNTEAMRIDTNGNVKLSVVGQGSVSDSLITWSATDSIIRKVPQRLYKVYTAMLVQSGLAAPTATVFENTLGATPTWSYAGVGQYNSSTVGGLIGQTNVFASATPLSGHEGSAVPLTISAGLSPSPWKMAYSVYDTPSGVRVDGHTIFLEIRVYP